MKTLKKRSEKLSNKPKILINLWICFEQVAIGLEIFAKLVMPGRCRDLSVPGKGDSEPEEDGEDFQSVIIT